MVTRKSFPVSLPWKMYAFAPAVSTHGKAGHFGVPEEGLGLVVRAVEVSNSAGGQLDAGHGLLSIGAYTANPCKHYVSEFYQYASM